MYMDIYSSPYSSRSSTWLKTVSIGVCGSYFIDLVFCSTQSVGLDRFPVRINQILDEHEESACELASGPVTHGCDIFFFYGQYELLNEASFHSSWFVEDS